MDNLKVKHAIALTWGFVMAGPIMRRLSPNNTVETIDINKMDCITITTKWCTSVYCIDWGAYKEELGETSNTAEMT